MLILGAILVALCGPAQRARADDVTLPPPDPASRITVDADQAERWQQGAHEVWVLHGHCVVAQGMQRATADEAVLWIKRSVDGADAMNRVIAYFDGNVVVSDGATAPQPGKPPTNGIECPTWLGQFYSSKDVTVGIADPGPEPTVKPALFRKALRRATAPTTRKSSRCNSTACRAA